MVYGTTYAHQTWKRKISPMLSTWLTFLIGTGLSLITYAIAQKHDFRSGILNVMDFLMVALVVVAILLWGKRGMRFKPFEKWYLGGIVGIVIYGIFSDDAFGSNIFTQVLISLGYIPTIQNLIVEKRNTESFIGWGCGFIAGLIALYPALIDGNALALLYAIRTIVLVGVVLSVMAYYKFVKK